MAESHLCQSDKIMQRIIKNIGTIPSNKTTKPHFHTLVVIIINQQLSVKAADTIVKRVLEKLGSRYFNAEKLYKLNEKSLSQCGLSRNKIRYIKTLAEAVVTNSLNFRKLVVHDDESIRKQLIDYPGIGAWSVDIFLMSGLQREDIFPIGDLIIRRSIQHHYSLHSDAHYDDYFSIAENWRPYRSMASYYLWRAFHQRKQ